jgi:hypothetical protein
VLLPLAACRPIKLAGEPVGQYRVTGTLQETSCGAGHPAPPSLTFHVELRREPASTYGYWKLPDGPLVNGAFDDEGFRFEQRAEVVGVPPDLDLGVVGCTLERAEIITGELASQAGDAAAPADGGQAGDAGAAQGAPFTGRTTIAVTPVAGGDCSPLLLPYGGAFPLLPCELRYTLEGVPLDEPIW